MKRFTIHAVIPAIGATVLAIGCLCAVCGIVGFADADANPAYIPPDPQQADKPEVRTAENDPFLGAVASEIASRYMADCACEACDCNPCQCGADNPEPQPQSSASMRPGYTLSLLTADWCVNCPRAKTAAYEASVAVELVDVDQHAPRAAELLSACPYKRSYPMWVSSRDGEPIKYWSGACDVASVEAMAAYEPAESTASVPFDPQPQPIYIPPPQPVYRPQPQYQYHQPMRGGFRRFFGGGCSGGRCG